MSRDSIAHAYPTASAVPDVALFLQYPCEVRFCTLVAKQSQCLHRMPCSFASYFSPLVICTSIFPKKSSREITCVLLQWRDICLPSQRISSGIVHGNRKNYQMNELILQVWRLYEDYNIIRAFHSSLSLQKLCTTSALRRREKYSCSEASLLF